MAVKNSIDPKEIVRLAWQNSGASQEEFAKMLNKSQPMLSKYISGSVIPPAEILILCMNKCGFHIARDISADALASRIMSELSGANYAEARAAINQILDSIKGSMIK